MTEVLRFINQQVTKHTDRKEWLGEGPWLHEADFVQFMDKDTGYACFINRARTTGALCGYVGVPPDNYFHGAGYNDMPYEIDVHGGLTYAGSGERLIQHETDFFEDYWIFGFDTAHHMDMSPALDKTMGKVVGESPLRRRHGEYRTIRYVKQQVVSLAKQLHRISIERGFIEW